MKVSVSLKNQVLIPNVQVADTLSSRLVGLMFKKELKGADGLLLDPCNSIHTCFMRYPIDVLFLDKHNRIVKMIKDLKPWRFTWIYFKASKTLEFPAGKFSLDLRVGDQLEVRDV